jgi:hypothetical protein
MLNLCYHNVLTTVPPESQTPDGPDQQRPTKLDMCVGSSVYRVSVCVCVCACVCVSFQGNIRVLRQNASLTQILTSSLRPQPPHHE